MDNARILVASGKPHLFRIPLIPGHNDSVENIKGTAEFIRRLSDGRSAIEVMPYHTLGLAKYRALGKPYPLEGSGKLEPDEVHRIQGLFQDSGVECLVSI